MEKKIEEPKDLGIKMGTPEEAAWTIIRDRAKKELEIGEREAIINKEIVKLAEKIIAKEKCT